MTRVSENSQTSALQYSLNRAKEKMENLQMKGTTLKTISKPSDNPLSNVEALSLISTTNDNIQFSKNSDFALLNLNVTEKSIEELTDIVNKAKEITIAQSSDFFNADVRKNVAGEIKQLYNQVLAIANKKVGLKHLFSGYNTLQVPFDSKGNYQGDKGYITLEVSRNFFVPINLTGEEVFYSDDDATSIENPLNNFEGFEKNQETESPTSPTRDLASEENPENGYKKRDNIFSQLQALITGLENHDPKMIQGLLEKFDQTVTRLVTLRTRIGSVASSVESTKNMIERENIDHVARRSMLLDADVADLFSDINKQQAILKTIYQSSKSAMSQTLMDFLHR
jgi:flagellar hook-associated protein 3 FlgL